VGRILPEAAVVMAAQMPPAAAVEEARTPGVVVAAVAP